VELKKGETIMIDAALHLPASFLHEAFCDRSGVPLGFFELYYRGKRLEGETALMSWEVDKGSTIEVKMRGRGGTSNRGKQPRVTEEEPTSSSNAHAAEIKAAVETQSKSRSTRDISVTAGAPEAAVARTAAEKATAAETAPAARPSRVPTALRKAPPRLVSVCDPAGVLSKVRSPAEYQTVIRSFARQQSGHPLTLLGVLTAEDEAMLTIDFPRTSFSNLLEMVREAFPANKLPGSLAESVRWLEERHKKLREIPTINFLMDEVAFSGSVCVGKRCVSLPTEKLVLHIGPIVVSLDDLSELSKLGNKQQRGVPLALPHTTLSSVVELASKALAAVSGSTHNGFLDEIDKYVNNGPKFVQARAH
jgi:hypothetical protein